MFTLRGLVLKVLLPLIRAKRLQRMDRFRQMCNLGPTDTLLDVGGDLSYDFTNIVGLTHTLFVVNIDISAFGRRAWGPDKPSRVFPVLADARRLPFADHSIDVVFSNSVIEHVPEGKEDFAREIMRVCRKAYFVQTPNEFFLLDAHNFLPLYGIMPLWLRRVLLRLMGTKMHAEHWLSITYVSREGLRQVFPGCTIESEKILGLAKSFYCYGPPSAPDPAQRPGRSMRA